MPSMNIKSEILCHAKRTNTFIYILFKFVLSDDLTGGNHHIRSDIGINAIMKSEEQQLFQIYYLIRTSVLILRMLINAQILFLPESLFEKVAVHILWKFKGNSFFTFSYQKRMNQWKNIYMYSQPTYITYYTHQSVRHLSAFLRDCSYKIVDRCYCFGSPHFFLFCQDPAESIAFNYATKCQCSFLLQHIDTGTHKYGGSASHMCSCMWRCPRPASLL